MVGALALAMVYMFASAGFFFLPEHLRREEDYYLFNNKRYSQSISETFMDFVHVMLVVGEGPLTEVDAQNRQGDVQSRFLFDIIFLVDMFSSQYITLFQIMYIYIYIYIE